MLTLGLGMRRMRAGKIMLTANEEKEEGGGGGRKGGRFSRSGERESELCRERQARKNL